MPIVKARNLTLDPSKKFVTHIPMAQGLADMDYAIYLPESAIINGTGKISGII
jgi:hypothetical protein